jgi:Zn-dependent oligopeptidase
VTRSDQPPTAEAVPDDPFDYRTISAELVSRTASDAMASADGLIVQAIAAAERPDASFGEVLGRVDRAEGYVWTASGRSAFMVRVHPDEGVRESAQAAEEQLTSWAQALPLRDDLARALRDWSQGSVASSLEGEQRRLLDRWLRDLRRAGHGLPDEVRAEIRSITDRLVVLESTFQRNVDEWSDGIDVSNADLEGMPDTYIARLSPGGEPGTLRISLDYPEYLPFMEGSPRRDLREILATKFASRAVALNRPLLEEALELRRRKATLLGYRSWAQYRIEPKMAGTPERVASFHAGLWPPLRMLAESEYARMARELERDTGDADLRVWDIAYYDRKLVSLEHGVDHDEASSYLVLDAVLDGLLSLTAEVFGLEIVQRDQADAWHPDVRLLDIRDASSEEHLGWCYLDLHPRPGKFSQAMAWPVRYPRHAGDGTREPGVSALIVNLPRSSPGAPALLRHDDVETLFHEFGHVLHEVLGRNESFRLSMYGVEDDFPEAISQIMENWIWEVPILRRISRHHESGQPMPEVLARRISASRTANLGSRYLRSFGQYGEFDLAIHGPEAVDLDRARVDADAIRGLPPIDAFWPASFDHIMGGYDAGYYGYLWSLVYGDDLWSRFESEGIVNPATGAAYRRELLEAGATRDAEEMVERFLGRPSTNQAFLERTGLNRIAAAAGS